MGYQTMSPVLTESDVSILMSQKTTDGQTLYLYPVVRDVDVLLTEESAEYENLGEMLEAGVKPNVASLQAIFQNSDDIEFEFDEETGTVVGTHKNVLAAGSATATSGDVQYGATIEIPTFSFDKNGHITSVGKSIITLPNEYVLPKASTGSLGGIIVGDGLNVDQTGLVSVKEATESEAGAVKLVSLTNSDSTTDAATPKAVSDALAAAIDHINNEISKIDMEGVTPNYADLMNIFTTSEDMKFTMDEMARTIAVTHRNSIASGEVIGTEGSVDAGSVIKIPAFSIDTKGHVTSHRLVSVSLPAAYTLPTASADVKGGIVIGDGLEIDPTTGETSVRKGSTSVEGMVKLSSIAESDSETEAATPKAVKDALTAAKEHANQAVENVKTELNEEGVEAKYSSVAGKLNSSDDIEAEKDDANEVIKFTHKNKIEAGAVASGDTSIINGGSINIPIFTYDSNGHLVTVGTETVTITPLVGENGIKIENEKIGHSNNIAAGTTPKTDTKKLAFGEGFKVPVVTYDANGHITAVSYETMTLPDNIDTTYTGSNGIVLDGTVFKHGNNVTAGSVVPGTTGDLTFGGTVKIPTFKYDANGHITEAGIVEFTLPDNPNVTYEISQTSDSIVLTGSDGKSTSIKKSSVYTHPISGVTAGTYRSVTVDAYGHVTAGSNPTTLAGYGITDAAKKEHTHGNDDITSIDGSKITGTVPISAIPAGALERLVEVASIDAMYALTTDDVQLGDTVQIGEGGPMYKVIDVTNLGNSKGYKVYTAGAASSVPWSGVTGKPDTYTPSAHTHLYAGSATAGGAATNAINDNENQNIAETYIKNITVSGTTVTITRGNGTSFTVKTQDTNTTYSAMTGASSSAAGAAGLVPAPAAGKQASFLRGDGTWATPTDTKYTHPTHTAYTSGLYKVTVDASGHVTSATAVTKDDITALGIPSTNTTYSAMTGASSSAAGAAGLVPAPAAGKQSSFLRGDGTWAVPTDTKYTHPSYTEQATGLYKITVDTTGHVSAVTAVTKDDITSLGIPSTNTTYSNMTAATSSAAGKAGLVPAPAAGKQSSFLRGDGTWAVPTDTKYTHPAYTAQASGLYKITVDATGHVSAVTAVTKADITALGIPSTNTTYSAVTESANGLATSAMLTKLNAISDSADAVSFTQSLTSGTKVGTININGEDIILYAPKNTDTHFTSHLYVGESGGNANATSATSNPYLLMVDNTTHRDGVQLKAGSNMSISAVNGVVTFTATDTKYTHPTHTAYTSGLYKVTVDASGHVTSATAVTKDDITALGIPSTNTTYSNMTAATSSAAGKAGLVPAPAAGKQSSFLRGDGTWAVPTNTTYSNMTAATADAAGKAGLVPAPAAGKQSSFLRGDGTWAVPTNTTYSVFVKSGSGAKAGLVPAPSTTAGTTKYLREDGTWVKPPNTTYSVATTSANGLMSSAMVSKMDGLDNNVVSDTAPSNPSTGYTMWFNVLSTES